MSLLRTAKTELKMSGFFPASDCQRRSKNLPNGGLKVGHLVHFAKQIARAAAFCCRRRCKSRPVCRELSGSQSGFALGQTVAVAIYL